MKKKKTHKRGNRCRIQRKRERESGKENRFEFGVRFFWCRYAILTLISVNRLCDLLQEAAIDRNYSVLFMDIFSWDLHVVPIYLLNLTAANVRMMEIRCVIQSWDSERIVSSETEVCTCWTRWTQTSATAKATPTGIPYAFNEHSETYSPFNLNVHFSISFVSHNLQKWRIMKRNHQVWLSFGYRGLNQVQTILLVNYPSFSICIRTVDDECIAIGMVADQLQHLAYCQLNRVLKTAGIHCWNVLSAAEVHFARRITLSQLTFRLIDYGEILCIIWFIYSKSQWHDANLKLIQIVHAQRNGKESPPMIQSMNTMNDPRLKVNWR